VPVSALCTISTYSHLFKAKALAASLREHGDFPIHILVTDTPAPDGHDNCLYYSLSDLPVNSTLQKIVTRYKLLPDKLRWSLKPIFMMHLLNAKNVERILYVDNDQFFYNSPLFLFELLEHNSILLTPHHYKINPNQQQNWFEANFRVGLFNAGFVGASVKGLDTLAWWAECCSYRCEKNPFRGLFDDQKYLDLVPVIDENAYIVRHRGCNVAGWNTELCQRTAEGQDVLINHQFPIVFVHYNYTTVREITTGNDALLQPYLDKYVSTLQQFKPELSLQELMAEPPLSDKLKLGIWRIVTEFGI
jgi:hypothetical protein